MEIFHAPVMLEETMRWLAPADGELYVDGNLGLGGHTARILECCGPAGKVVGFDWDADALAMARERLAAFGNRILFVHRNFAEMKDALSALDISEIDGLLLDLGLSSFQLDASGRGFSFKGDEPLDMRMDEREEMTAAYVVNTATEQELADIFYYYGEERQARRIASVIVEERKRGRIATTGHLVRIVQKAVPKRFHPKKIHVATKVFQGLRIAVNRELKNLAKALADGADLLKPRGRFCVISFHSLEDRLVKQAFRKDPRLEVLTSKPVSAGEEECRTNPRARSAKLRAARKC